MLLDDVRAALEESAELVPTGSIASSVVLIRARRKVRRRRVARAATATLVLGAIASAIVIATHHASSPARVVVAAPTTTLPVQAHGDVAAEQLAAHLGIGVPAGWVPVDWGDARVFVPKDWVFESAGSCVQDTNAPGLISTGPSSCDTGPVAAPASISITSLTANPPSVAVVAVVHGYRVYARVGVPADNAYYVPELGVALAMTDSPPIAVLRTLAPSARRVALAFAHERGGPSRAITTDGVRLNVPSTWTITTPEFLPCSWPGAVPGLEPEVVRITGSTGVPPCAGPGVLVGGYVRDGAFVFAGASSLAPVPNGRFVAVLHHGSTTVRVSTEPGDANVLDVFARRDGSPTTHVLQLGLGRDGRIAGGVLASIEAVS